VVIAAGSTDVALEIVGSVRADCDLRGTRRSASVRRSARAIRAPAAPISSCRVSRQSESTPPMATRRPSAFASVFSTRLLSVADLAGTRISDNRIAIEKT